MSKQVDIRARLDEIKARADAATEGPWSVHRSERTGTYVTRPDLLGIAREWSLVWQDGDAEFIAHARTDVPWLIEYARQRDAALTAVLDLHRPVDIEPSETICHGCSTLRGEGKSARYFPFEDYPCPTVTAITSALGGDRG